MARRGVWQLSKLSISYCDISGSSRGTREFVQHWLPRFREENPQIDIIETVRRGRHPSLLGSYKNGNRRAVALRNEAPDEVLRQAVLLRSCTGRKASLQVKNRTQTQRSSIQGVWNAKLQDQLKSQNPPQ